MVDNNPINSVIMLVVGVSIAILILIFTGVLSGQVYQSTESDLTNIGATETKVNESFTAINGTAVALSYPFLADPTIYNVSTLIKSTNFTYNATSGTVTLTSGTKYNNTVLNATYTYRNTTIESSIRNSIVSSFEAQEKTAAYLPIIVLAIIIAIVLSLVLGYTVFAGNNQGPGKNNAL